MAKRIEFFLCILFYFIFSCFFPLLILFGWTITGWISANGFSQRYLRWDLWKDIFIDPVPIIPASYIIDLHGKPLDVITITEGMDDVVFTSRVRTAAAAVCSLKLKSWSGAWESWRKRWVDLSWVIYKLECDRVIWVIWWVICDLLGKQVGNWLKDARLPSVNVNMR